MQDAPPPPAKNPARLGDRQLDGMPFDGNLAFMPEPGDESHVT